MQSSNPKTVKIGHGIINIWQYDFSPLMLREIIFLHAFCVWDNLARELEQQDTQISWRNTKIGR
jgi:hypothetical protein